MKNFRYKNMIKKATAAFLAVLMASTYIPLFQNQLAAATPQLSAGFTQGLVPGGMILDPSPILQPGALPDGQVHLSWPLEWSTTLSPSFNLDFPIGNGMRNLYVHMVSDTVAYVQYRPGGGVSGFSVNRGHLPGNPGVNFSPLDGPGALEANAPPHPDPMNPGFAPGFYDGRYYPNAHSDDLNPNTFVDLNPANAHQPLFRITRGEGFSLSLQSGPSVDMTAAHSLSFLWAENGTFHVVTGGLDIGRIYDFTLTRGTETPTTQYVFTGFEYYARPLARHRDDPRAGHGGAFPANWAAGADPLFNPPRTFGPAPGTPLDGFTNWDLDDGTNYRGLAHPANHLFHRLPVGRQQPSNPQNDWYPAGFMPHELTGSARPEYPVRENLMELIVHVPQRWDSVAGTWDTMDDPTATFTASNSLNFIFNNFPPLNPAPFNFFVNDFFGANPFVEPSGMANVIHLTPRVPGANEYIRMIIDGQNPFALPPSQIFPNSIMRLEGTLPDGFVSRGGVTEMGRVYTFLEYSVVFMEGQFHVRIIPYAGVAGTYSLNFLLGQGLQDTVFVDSGETLAPIFIPLIIPPGGLATFQVVFTPADTRIEPIPSQFMVFEATYDRMILTAPIDFTVTRNHPDLRYVLGGEGLAEFDITASWTMGQIATMRGYFEQLFPGGADGEIVFTYHIRSRDYHEQTSDEAISLAQVDVVFRREGGEISWWAREVRMNPDLPLAQDLDAVGVDLFVTSGAPTVTQGADMQFNVFFDGAAYAGAVAWSVQQYDPATGTWGAAVAATIGANGLLEVNNTPVGTRLRAVANGDAFAAVTVVQPNVIPATMTGDNDLTISIPLTFVADYRDGNAASLLLYEGIYFLTNTLISVQPDIPGWDPIGFNPTYLHESRHNDRSFLSLSRPDLREFPPPYNLQVWVNPDEDDNREHGHFDMSFMVPWQDIMSYAVRSPFREYYWDVTYRIFIGNNAEISRIAQLRAEQRTTAIVYAVAGTVVPSNILGIRHIDYMEPPVASGHELEVNGDNDQDIFDLSPWIEYLRGDPPTTAPRAIVLEVPLRVPHDFPLVDFLQTFRFEGLDYNWPYYVFVDSFIQFVDENGDPPAVQTPPSREYSNNTDVRGIITRTDLIEPDPGEIIPTAPRDLRVESVASTRANISWLDVARPADIPGARIEFEIVRMRAGQVLPESLLNRRDQNLAQFVYAMSPEAQANFEAATRTNRVMGADGQMVLTLINPDPAIPGMSATAYNDFTLMHSPGGRVELENTGLAPNTLYFYYVRTVWITPQGEMFSTWNGISVTTTIVEPPVNLRIVDGRAFPEANLNPENQIVIRFEANVGSVEGGTGNVQNDHGSEFDFRFSLRADGGDWTAPVFLPSEMNGSGTHRLLERVPTQGMPGYYTFTYVISGLDPGTTYSVRVHTFDIQNSAGGGAFDEVYSEWSNIATTRTDADQEFFNRERERENMRQYLRDLLMEFVRRPYWISRDFGNLFAGLYRPSMINYLLDTNSNMVRLTATDNDVNVFYLPQPLFLAMWDSGQGFVVQRDGMEITIPNQAINNINSQPVIQAVQRIRDVGGVNDYYIRLSVDMRTPANQHVNGLPVKGSQVSLTVELVESSVLTRQLDQDILRRIMYLIETDHFIDNLIPGRTVTFAQEIDNLVARGAPWPERVRRLYEMRDIIFQEMSNEVSSRLHPTRGRTTTFNYFDQAISIGINNIGGSTAVSGFQLAGQNNWASLNVRQQGTNRVMSTQVPGIFAFGGQILVLPGLNTIPNHDTLQALIVRYGLTDFLGVDATFNVNNPISLSAVQGVAARLAGAPAAASPQNWLRGRGYIIPVRGAGAPAQTQEVVYTIMALYEIRTGTRVSALRITNFAALNGISGIDARYRPFIQAAFQLGIYNNANMQPTATMTVGEFLRLIAALDQRVGF